MTKPTLLALLLLPTIALAAPPRRHVKQARSHATRRPPPPRFPSVTVAAPNARETLTFRPFDERGRTRPAAARELAHLLRDTHTGKRHAVDPRLGRLIYAIARHYGKPLEVYSGYRAHAPTELEHSRHRNASAIDFHVQGVANDALVAWLRASFHPVGVGYYPGGQHVHVDVDRTEDTFWTAEEQPLGAPIRYLGRGVNSSFDDRTGAVPDPGMPAAPCGVEDDEEDEGTGPRLTIDPGLVG